MWRLPRSERRMESRCVNPVGGPLVDHVDMLVLQNKQLEVVKGGSRGSSGQTSRAVSVSSNGTSSKAKAKGRKK